MCCTHRTGTFFYSIICLDKIRKTNIFSVLYTIACPLTETLSRCLNKLFLVSLPTNQSVSARHLFFSLHCDGATFSMRWRRFVFLFIYDYHHYVALYYDNTEFNSPYTAAAGAPDCPVYAAFLKKQTHTQNHKVLWPPFKTLSEPPGEVSWCCRYLLLHVICSVLSLRLLVWETPPRWQQSARGMNYFNKTVTLTHWLSHGCLSPSWFGETQTERQPQALAAVVYCPAHSNRPAVSNLSPSQRTTSCNPWRP